DNRIDICAYCRDWDVRAQIIYPDHQKDDTWVTLNDFFKAMQNSGGGIAAYSPIQNMNFWKQFMPVSPLRYGITEHYDICNSGELAEQKESRFVMRWSFSGTKPRRQRDLPI